MRKQVKSLYILYSHLVLWCLNFPSTPCCATLLRAPASVVLGWSSLKELKGTRPLLRLEALRVNRQEAPGKELCPEYTSPDLSYIFASLQINQSG